jgi:PAS domain S-box-containing protein
VRLLDAVHEAHAEFLVGADAREAFARLLSTLLSFTRSEYGFIGETLRRPDGTHYLKTHAITNVAWNDETRAFVAANAPQGLEFVNPDTLFGAVLLTGEPVLANDPARDPRRGGLPDGHPPMRAFMGLPIRHGGRLVGMVGVANRPGGYDDRLVRTLRPFLAACASLIVAWDAERARRAAEAALRASEARLQALHERFVLATEEAAIGVWDYDVAHDRLVWDERMFRIFGVDPAAFGGRFESWRATLHPEDRDAATAAAECALRTGGRFSAAFRVVRRDGEVRHVRGCGRVVRDAAGAATRFIGINYDVTEERRGAEERERLEARLRHAQRLESLGVLAGGLAHDFNNLLTGVLGNAELALLELADGHPARDCVADAEKAARRAAELTQQMLAYSGRGKFKVGDVSLPELLGELRRLVAHALRKGCTVSYRCDAETPTVRGDATQLRQVAMNLVLNAAEATAEGGGRVVVRTGAVRIAEEGAPSGGDGPALPPGRYAFLEVEDDGCGMTAETRARIFEPFFTTKFAGRGLGLSAALGIVRAHRGGVEVRSAAGAGTTFRVLLPAVEADAPSAADDAASAAAAWRGAGRALVVDDEPLVREVARQMLRRLGFDVVCAEDGNAGLELFRTTAADAAVAILDVTMPGLDGVELFREIRRIRPGAPVVFASGFGEQAAPLAADGDPRTAFVHKPFDLHELARALRRVVSAEAIAAG